MREIKFRGYHREKKCWLDTVHVFGDGSWSGSLIEERGEIDGYDERECELMQFTGLKDKLGREVYEGDIIRNSNADICQIPAEVYWEEFGGQFRLATGGERQYDKTRPMNFVRIGEVTGNIYEHSYLLDKKTEKVNR